MRKKKRKKKRKEERKTIGKLFFLLIKGKHYNWYSQESCNLVILSIFS